MEKADRKFCRAIEEVCLHTTVASKNRDPASQTKRLTEAYKGFHKLARSMGYKLVREADDEQEEDDL